jgi:amino acid transporter
MAHLIRRLNFFDGATLLVGTVLGAGIVGVPSLIAQRVPEPGLVIAIWFFSGLLVLCGALALAELGTMLPQSGGLYIYMREAYGPPLRVNEPPTLSSKQAVLDHVLPEADREGGMPPLWNEQTRQSDFVLHRLRDEEIRLGLWDPFAAWRFGNQVVVQVFMHSTLGEDGKPTPLTPVWIFSKEDRFKTWKKAVARSTIIEPRDF